MQVFNRVLPGVMVILLVACSDRTPEISTEPETAPAPTAVALSYPETRKVDVVDDYHGTLVADPYRWLEQDVRESEAVAEWVAAQNRVTDAYLGTLEMREHFGDRLAALWNYERFGLPVKRGQRYFFTP